LAIAGVLLIAGISIWQFYLFAASTQDNVYHLWRAIFTGLLAYITGFFVYTVFLRYDKKKILVQVRRK
jgi:hypothetical protein